MRQKILICQIGNRTLDIGINYIAPRSGFALPKQPYHKASQLRVQYRNTIFFMTSFCLKHPL